MKNYAKKNITVNPAVMDSIKTFDRLSRDYAKEALENSATKKALTEELEKLEKAGKDGEAIKAARAALDSCVDSWKARTAAYNLDIYGGKVKTGDSFTECEGVLSFIPEDIYPAYVAMIKDNKPGKFNAGVRAFALTLFDEKTINDTVFNWILSDIKLAIKSTRYNSTRNIAEGCRYITTVNKRTFLKMFAGALCDIISNNRTLKVKKEKKAEAK